MRAPLVFYLAFLGVGCVGELGGAPDEPALGEGRKQTKAPAPEGERAVTGGSGEGTSGEVACPSTSCAALASGTTNILSCQDGATLVRCESGTPRCFACRAGHACFFNNGGAGRDDHCAPKATAPTCAPCTKLAAGSGAIWSCEEGAARLVRCVAGCLETRACQDGCSYNNGGFGNDDRCGKAPSSSGFAWPVAGATLTQGFGCGNCAWYAWNAAWGCCLHNGLDLAAPWGTPVKASAAGTVISAAWSDVNGYFAELDHGGGAVTYYGHLAQQPYVSVGQWVAQGETLAPMGSTGLSTGPHTHFMLRQGGVAVDPRPFLP